MTRRSKWRVVADGARLALAVVLIVGSATSLLLAKASEPRAPYVERQSSPEKGRPGVEAGSLVVLGVGLLSFAGRLRRS